MRNDKRLLFAAAGLGAAAMIAVPLIAAAASGKLMHMTMHMTMNMPGMGGAPRTFEKTVCMPTGKFDPQAIQNATRHNQDMQCHAANVAWSGKDIRYDMVCTGRANVTVHATAHVDGDDAFSGKSHMTMTMPGGGQSMTMDEEYTGKRVGSCDYTPPST